MGFLVLSNTAATVLLELPLAKDCDCRRVAAALGNGESPVLVFPPEDALPLAMYYRGKSPLIPVPRPASLEVWDQRSFVIHDQSQIGSLLARRGDSSAGFWVHTDAYGDKWGRDKLESFLSKSYREDERREFARGTLLRHFVKSDTALR
jgi:hypothetical protein